MAAYRRLLYNILRKSKGAGCPAMPAGHIHLGRDTVAQPGTQEKTHLRGAWVRSQRSPAAREGGAGDRYPCGQRYTARRAQLFPAPMARAS